MIGRIVSMAAIALAFTASLAHADPIAQSPTAPFWGGGVNRLNRTFFGPAAANDGTSNNPNYDWFSALGGVSYNGGYGINSNGNYAQVYILQDPNSSIAGQAVPQSALVVGAESANVASSTTVEAGVFTAVNNAPPAYNPSVWATYMEAHRVSASSANTYGTEIEVRNSANGGGTYWTPYYQVGYGTVAIDAGCGAGLPAAGQLQCTSPFVVGANPIPFSEGILFANGSLAQGATGGTTTAMIEAPHDYQIQWYISGFTVGASVYGDASGNLHVDTNGTPGHLIVNNQRVYCGVGATIPC